MTPSDIVTYIKAGNQLSVSEVMVLADVIEQQAATIARLSAPATTLESYTHRIDTRSYDAIIQERLNGK